MDISNISAYGWALLIAALLCAGFFFKFLFMRVGAKRITGTVVRYEMEKNSNYPVFEFEFNGSKIKKPSVRGFKSGKEKYEIGDQVTILVKSAGQKEVCVKGDCLDLVTMALGSVVFAILFFSRII